MYRVRGGRPTQSRLEHLETVLLCQQFLPLDLDLSLNFEFDFSQFVFFPSELFFLESNRLVGHVLRQDRGITVSNQLEDIDRISGARGDLRIATSDRFGEFLSTPVFV